MSNKNEIAPLYTLARTFINLSIAQKFQIGLNMSILTREDMVMDPADMEEYIFESIIQEKRILELWKHISYAWEDSHE
jgi:hypothetical protein